MLLTLLGRERQKLAAAVFFPDLEIKVLTASTKKLLQPLLLRRAMRLVAQLGGYLGWVFWSIVTGHSGLS